MMNKQSTGKAWRWKVAIFLPLLALLLMAFGRTGESKPMEIKSAQIQPQAQPSSIIGTWKLVSYNYNGGDKLIPLLPVSKRIKFITETNFNWVQYAGEERLVTSSAGGTYVLSGDSYTENIEFGGQDMTDYIGKTQKFNVRIEDNKMHLSGELSSGLRIKEVWERYQPSDKTSLASPSSVIQNENQAMQSVNNLKKSVALPPPPPPSVINKGLGINLVGENIQVNNKPISMEQLEKLISDLKNKKEFVEITTNSSTNKTVETEIKELLEKQNVPYRIIWYSKMQ